jgi:hypothetical protein
MGCDSSLDWERTGSLPTEEISMPGRWTSWKPLDEGYFQAEDSCGIYEIRIVDGDGTAIPVPRMGGIDPVGILYIGKSGVTTAKSPRTLAKRLGEFFWSGRPHSGGETFDQMVPLLRRRLGKFQLQYRVVRLHDEAIDTQEKRQIRRYFQKYCELPPGNSAFPGKWELNS